MDEKKEYNCGIYQIRNLVNGKIYIGSSKDFRKRKSKHISELRKQEHSNKHLQAAWNLYNKENFVFEMLEYVEEIEDKEKLKNILIEKEQIWMDLFKSYKNGYNIRIKAESSYGMKRSTESINKTAEKNRGQKRNKEQIKRMSESHIGIKQSEESILKRSKKIKGVKQSKEAIEHRTIKMKGKKLSDEHKIKLSDSHAKLKEVDIRNIISLLFKGEKIKNIANQFNVKILTIYDIMNRKTYKHLISEDEKNIIKEIYNKKKLNEEDVILIRKMLLDNIKPKEISQKYNIDITTVYKIKSNELWENVG